MLKNVTVTVKEEALRWARHQAAEQATSVSKFLGQILEREMSQTDAYRQAYERWKKLKPIPGLDASKRLTREEVHDRTRFR